MSFVGGPFVHDLFVSYSHGTDANGRGQLRNWSTAFAQALEDELRSEPGLSQHLRVFLDGKHRPGEGVDPMSGLTGQLEQEIGASAVLLVLMSPHYLASEWCRKEREAWVARQQALAQPTEGRIAVVRIWPTDEPWPAELCDNQGVPLVGFSFSDDSLGAVRPLGWTETKEGFGSAFHKALLTVSGRLTFQLNDLRKRLAEQQQAKADAQRLQFAGGQSIYLHGRETQRRAWEDAAQALVDHGFAVVPGDPDPVANDPQTLLGLRQQRVATLADCDALLLLATEDGRALDDDMLAVGRHDRNSAISRGKRLLPCGVLDTVGTPVANSVRRATARNLMTDWLDGTQQPWAPRVQQWLRQQGAAELGRQ